MQERSKKIKSKDIESPIVTNEKGRILSKSAEDPGQCTPSTRPFQRFTTGHTKNVSFSPEDTVTAAATETAISPEVGPSQVTSPETPSQLPSTKDGILSKTLPLNSHAPAAKHDRHRVVTTTLAILRSLITPASLSIIISFIISLVPTLKALFVPGVPGTHIPSAPDGLPRLSFVIDAASFIGAASVPLGLICLGSALARLKVPRGQWGQLPLGAIGGLAVGKLLITPVLGVLICQGLTNVGVIDKNDKVLRYVCMWVSNSKRYRVLKYQYRALSGFSLACQQQLPRFVVSWFLHLMGPH
jgi:hypothetical protein